MAKRLAEIGSGLAEDSALIPADYGAKEMFVIEICVPSFGLDEQTKTNIFILIYYVLM